MARPKLSEDQKLKPIPQDVPEPPDWLTDRARELWFHIGADLAGQGKLSPGLEIMLGRYCSLAHQLEQLTQLINKEGSFDELGKGPSGKKVRKLSAEFVAADKIDVQLRQFGRHLGISTGRVIRKAPGGFDFAAPPHEDDEMAEFLQADEVLVS